MKLLVLGGSGFIGSRLVTELLSQGHIVRVLTRKAGSLSDIPVEIIIGDLVDPDFSLYDLIKDCDVVINCAGEISDVALMRELHVSAIKNLLRVMNDFSTQSRSMHFVQLSSVGAYGPGDGKERVVTEETITNPVGAYEITKTEADKLVMGVTGDLTWSILRPSNVYGLGMPNGSLRQLATMVSKRLFFYIGYQRSIATYIHVDDVVSALFLCATHDAAKGQVFNLSNDRPLQSVINAMANYYSVPSPKLKVPLFLVRSVVYLASRVVKLPITQARISALTSRTHYPSSKIEKILSFSPSKALDAHISDIF